MKYILLLLLSFNLYAQSESQPAEPLVFCGLESHAEIDACTLDHKFGELMKRLHSSLSYKSYSDYNAPDPCDPEAVDNPETEEIETCPVWDMKTGYFTYAPQIFNELEPTLSMYERLEMINKPALLVFETDLSDWKQAEKNKLDFRNSIKGMNRFRRRMQKCGYNQPNMALLKKDIIENMDSVKRDCLQSQTVSLDTEDAEASLENQIANDIKCGAKLKVAFIKKIRTGGPQNTARNKRLLSKLSAFKGLIDLGDIDGGKEELNAVQTDQDFSQQDKDDLISGLNGCLGI